MKIKVYINCKKCSGTGEIKETIYEDGLPAGQTVVACPSCDGGKAHFGEIDDKFYDNIKDDLKEIMDKCKDIYNKVK